MALAMSMVRAKTGKFFLTVFESDGVTPQDLTGAVLYFHAGGQIDIDKDSPSNGITITDTLGGLATLVIDPADTEALPEGAAFALSCELVLESGGDEYPINQGTLTIQPNVGTP